MEKQNELEQLEKEMKKLNVDIVDKAEIVGDRFLAVEADIDCEVELDFMRKLVMTKKVMRGSIYYVKFDTTKRTGTLTLTIYTKLPEDYLEVYKKADLDQLTVLATTYMDLCWIHSEGTTPQTLNEVATAHRAEEKLGDLTWVLPSKFVDDFVEMMHTLNQGIISGLMQDAIVYGPYVFSREEV